jgi:hypothetical protein
MMHGRGKSDLAIVARKSVNRAEQLAAELMERRTGAKGNVDQQPRAGHRTGKACHKRWNAYDIAIMREAGHEPVSAVSKRHGVSEQTIYAWRKRFGGFEVNDVRRLRQLEAENA